MSGAVTEARARAQAALARWREARRAVNDPASVPRRLDQIVAVTERAIGSIGQDVITEIDALLVELTSLTFPVEHDDALGGLEQATLMLDGALIRIVRAASRAGFAADDDDDLGLPPGVRVPVEQLAGQLEAFATAVENVRPVLHQIEGAQAADHDSGAKQNALVHDLIRKAEVKIGIIEAKTTAPNLIDVSGLATLAKQLTTLLQSFAATVREAAGRVSSWLQERTVRMD